MLIFFFKNFYSERQEEKPSDDGWNTVGSKSIRIDASKMKFSKVIFQFKHQGLSVNILPMAFLKSRISIRIAFL